MVQGHKNLEDMKASEVGLLMMQEEARLKEYPLTERGWVISPQSAASQWHVVIKPSMG